jgi:CSLREA domain-containing protein
VKIDGAGNVRWSRTYDGGGGEGIATAVMAADGDFLLAGSTGSDLTGYDDMYVVRTDADGQSGCNTAPATVETTAPTLTVSTFVPESASISLTATTVSTFQSNPALTWSRPLCPVPPATFQVNIPDDTVDANPGDGVCADASGRCSLRAAVMEANALGGGPHTIVLQAGQTYTLSRAAASSSTDLLHDDLKIIDATIIIQGNGATIQRAPDLPCNLDNSMQPGEFRIFTVGPLLGAGLTLDGVTLKNGCAEAPPGLSGRGGGVVFYAGDNSIRNSTITENRAEFGGGIYNGGGTLTIINSTISGNSAVSDGGGIWNDYGTVNASFVTIANNSATNNGGGVINFSGGTFNIKNSIVGNNTAGGNCSGTLNASGVNFATDNTCTGFTQVTSAQLNLQPLANNGGPTQTHALGAGSVAIDAVTDCTDLSSSPVSTDQRGVTRPQGSRCDAGAFEREAAGYRLHLPLVVRGP